VHKNEYNVKINLSLNEECVKLVIVLFVDFIITKNNRFIDPSLYVNMLFVLDKEYQIRPIRQYSLKY
jgi:hypothetical protein